MCAGDGPDGGRGERGERVEEIDMLLDESAVPDRRAHNLCAWRRVPPGRFRGLIRHFRHEIEERIDHPEPIRIRKARRRPGCGAVGEGNRGQNAEADHRRRREVEVPRHGITVLQAMRAGGVEDSALLLSRAPVDRRQLPHVPGRNPARHAQADRVLRDAGGRPRRTMEDPHRARNGRKRRARG